MHELQMIVSRSDKLMESKFFVCCPESSHFSFPF